MPRDANDIRQRTFDWLVGLGMAPTTWRPLTGDVSPRRYFRVGLHDDPNRATAVVASYPPSLAESLDRFRRATRLLEGVHVSTPRILATGTTQGFMLLEDLGEGTLYDHRGAAWSRLTPFLREARSIIEKIHTLPGDEVAALNPPLDGSALRAELQQTWDLFLVPEGLCGTRGDEKGLERLLDEICNRLHDSEQRPSHRDFMARNLMLRSQAPHLTVIDHQDLRMAPAAYDLASLFNDSLYPPDELALSMLGDIEEMHYRRCAAQRTLKIIGTFVKFAQAGAPRYLELVPLTLSHCLRHLRALPESGALSPALAHHWEPVLSKAPVC